MPRRVRIDLAYDGTDYQGWQLQPGRPTVQGVLEEALARIHGGVAVRVRGAGRTDAGVHARGQVADCVVGDRMSDRELAASLNALLPEDVRVVDLGTVPEAFHSRHDAVAKTYAYSLDRTPAGDPFLTRYALHAPRPLDLDAIDAALQWLPGTRDWTGFTGAACTIDDRVRTLTVARRDEVRTGVTALVFTADGFLTHMVRNLVGTLLEIGRKRFPPERLAEIIGSGNRGLAGATAPSRGLSLERVDYPPGPLW